MGKVNVDRCGSEVDELFMLWDGAEVRWIEVFTGVTFNYWLDR